MKKLLLEANHLSREQWISSMMNTLLPKFPQGYSLGITDDEYSEAMANYIVDASVEMLNCLLTDGHYVLDEGDLYYVAGE